MLAPPAQADESVVKPVSKPKVHTPGPVARAMMEATKNSKPVEMESTPVPLELRWDYYLATAKRAGETAAPRPGDRLYCESGSWAVIKKYEAGDFSFKIDPRDLSQQGSVNSTASPELISKYGYPETNKPEKGDFGGGN